MTYSIIGILASMILLITFQIAYPLLPFYAMGYMLGSCVLHSFVVEDERNEYRRDLENSLQRERRQIMINILGNAVKFTPEGGSVSLFIEEGVRYNGKAVLKLVFKYVPLKKFNRDNIEL